MTVPHKHQVPEEDRAVVADETTAPAGGAEITLFVNPALVVLLADETQVVTLRAGEILFNEGDASASMYVVKRGTLRIRSADAIYEDIGAGGIVGEMGVVENHMPRSATVHALTPCELVELGQQQFLDLVERKPGFSISVMRVLSRRLRHMNLTRRADSAPQAASMRVGTLELRFDINRAFWRSSAIDLTMTEFRMVSRLALKAGDDVSYRELYDLVHGKDFLAGSGADGYRANARTFIKRIRKKFRAVDPTFDQVRNYAGFGYRWAAK
jgi:CRP-like cAMP-binding protein